MSEFQILKTKLKEVESMLDDGIIRGLNSHEEIEQKLNLASTEFKSSHPSTNPQHMDQILQRLESVRKSFNERDKDSISHFTIFSNPEYDKDSISNSGSSSSSTQSCLNDDVGETLDDAEKLFPEFVGEKAIVEFRGNGVEKIGEKSNVGGGKIGTFFFQDAKDSFEDFGKENEVGEIDYCLKEKGKKDNELERGEGRKKSGFGKNCCALVSGVCIGMVLMGFIMVNLSGCFEYVEQTSFAIPT